MGDPYFYFIFNFLFIKYTKPNISFKPFVNVQFTGIKYSHNVV